MSLMVTYSRDKRKAMVADLARGDRLPDATEKTTVRCDPSSSVIYKDGVLTIFGPDVDIQVAQVGAVNISDWGSP